jgi:hypothetical protein
MDVRQAKTTYKKPRDGRFAEWAFRAHTVDVSVHGWKA